MNITVTLSGGHDDVPKLARLLQDFGGGTITVQEQAGKAPPVDTQDEGDRAGAVAASPPEPARRRGRPAKAAAPEGAALNGADPHPEPAAEAAIDDAELIDRVRAFSDKHPGLGKNITSLLREFDAERVSQVPALRRVEFLEGLASLASLS